jgi:hypothetical protein
LFLTPSHVAALTTRYNESTHALMQKENALNDVCRALHELAEEKQVMLGICERQGGRIEETEARYVELTLKVRKSASE